MHDHAHNGNCDHTHARHEHSYVPKNMNGIFKAAIALNTCYVLFELAAGLSVGSLALLADSAHNLIDVAGLLVAWGAMVVSTKGATGRFTYGFGRTTILAALINAVVIFIGTGAVVLESVQRFASPQDTPPFVVMIVAAIGIAINGGTAWLFVSSRGHDLNAKGAYLHMLTDAAVSLGVVIGAIILAITGMAWIDPAIALVVSIMVAVMTFDLLKSSLSLTLDAVPESVNKDDVHKWLAQQTGVKAVHDLHIWALSTTQNALTVHLVIPNGGDDAFLSATSEELEHLFGIHHATIQIEGKCDVPCVSGCAHP